MKEEQRNELNLLLNIINIDNKLKIAIDTTTKTKEKEHITQFDIVCIDEMLKNIYKYIELIKKYDIDYNKTKQTFDKVESELTAEQKRAIKELLQQNNEN